MEDGRFNNFTNINWVKEQRLYRYRHFFLLHVLFLFNFIQFHYKNHSNEIEKKKKEISQLCERLHEWMDMS